jgi:hypothetical protein
MKSKPCKWCDLVFEANVSYQIYCSIDCRAAATKEKIAIRYQISRRENRIGKDRSCKSCSKPLSIYNDDALCQTCLINPKDVSKALKEIRKITNEKD